MSKEFQNLAPYGGASGCTCTDKYTNNLILD